MTNAQTELFKHIEGKSVEFIKIAFKKEYGVCVNIEGSLEEVTPKLNFKYDSGYGGQELFGYIWYTDGTWSDRREYDGLEWWEHQERPSKSNEVCE